MNSLTKSGIAAIAIAGIVTASAYAQGGFAQNRMGAKNGQHGEARFGKKIAEQLNLTEDQKTKIKTIQTATREQMKPILKAEMSQIMALLTPEQKAKLATLRKKGAKQMAGGGFSMPAKGANL